MILILCKLMECKTNRLTQPTRWHQSPFPKSIFLDSYPSPAASKVPLSTFWYSMPLMEKTPHVGIIGAGIAGLRCADILIQNGVRVTIIEARDRIGGRVRLPVISSPERYLTTSNRFVKVKSEDTLLTCRCVNLCR